MNVRWSPDGTTIGYLALADNERSVWMIDSNGEHQRVVIEDAHSFDWYPGSNKIIYNRIAKSKSGLSELRIWSLTTGADTLLYNGQLTEIFVKSDGTGIGFIQGTGHWTQNIYFLPLKVPLQKTDFPLVIGEPQQLTDGEGIWHAHNGTWAPYEDKIIYVRDEDLSNIYIVENRKF
jgi:Tol biopolymer transport system component